MYPQQQKSPKKKPNRTLLTVLMSIAGVLTLILCVGIVGALVTDGDDDASTPAADSISTPAADTGIPPKPDAKTQAAYIAALKDVDPGIVEEKDAETLVDRGRNQCSSVKEAPDDQVKLIELTNKRFTSPEHPDGYGKAKATKILAAVREHLCPTY